MKKQHNQSLIGFNAIVLLMACSFFLTSCTSLQQTTTVATDDLYFTPSKEAETSTKTTARNNSAEAEVTEEAEYQDYQNYQDDRYLRLKVANRNRWSSIDDFGYWNNPSFINMRYGLGWGGGFGGWGGGFGGCTINIIKKSEVQAIINSVADIYAQQTAHTLKVHQVKIAQGTHIK